MKKIILATVGIILLAVPTVIAAPFVVSDDFTASLVDSCVITLDGIEHELEPSLTTEGLARCIVDVGEVVDGSHDMTLHTKNMWGGSVPVPFAFTKELPPTLLNIRLEN